MSLIDVLVLVLILAAIGGGGFYAGVGLIQLLVVCLIVAVILGLVRRGPWPG